MTSIFRYLSFSMIFFYLVGCSRETIEPASFESQVETVVAATMAVQTEIANPQKSFTSVPTLTTIPATEVPFGEVYIYTYVDNVNLRTNPGTLFQVSRVLANGTRLRLLGQSPGGEWFNVLSDEGINGWVNRNVVQVGYDGPPPPIVEPSGVFVITGSVHTELGTPVNGIGFAIVQGSRRTDAVTDVEGKFYAYLPQTLSGSWDISYVSVSCSSNTMDSNCVCINETCGTAHPEIIRVELPQVVPVEFIWK